jgi:lipoprotein-releasing system ATP-binding protein
MSELVVEHLSKQYPTRDEPLRVLRDVSLQMSLGENLAIVGPSGSGKSTLLQIIGTLDRPTSGQVRLGGQNPFALPDWDLAAFRNQKIGFVFQDHYLLPQLSAVENVLVPTLAKRKPSQEVCRRASELLDRVGLANRMQHRPSELSGGERQRVAIARALVQNPQLLMADEPTGNLDRTTAESVTDLLLELQGQSDPKTMMIVVTHSQALAERLQRCYELDLGQLK